MATVDGLTKARMLAIEAESIVDGHVDGSSHLILTTHGGTDIDAGDVKGDKGDTGDAGADAPIPYIVGKSSNYTALDGEIVYVDATSNDVTISVPVTVNAQVVVKRLDNSAHLCKVAPVSGVFQDNAAAYALLNYNGVIRTIGDSINVELLEYYEGGHAFPKKIPPFIVTAANQSVTTINTFQIMTIALGGTASLWNAADANAALMGCSISGNYIFFSEAGKYHIDGFVYLIAGSAATRCLLEMVPEIGSFSGTLTDHDNLIRADRGILAINDSDCFPCSVVLDVPTAGLKVRLQKYSGSTLATFSATLRIQRIG